MRDPNERRIVDLGGLTGPVLIFGGPYSNLAATQTMRTIAEELGIPPERTICTGDVVAYCAQPGETVDLIRDWGVALVQGNCEESLGAGAPDCGCGFDDGSTCSLLSMGWYRYADERISEADRLWMKNLPHNIRLTVNGKSILVVHGGVKRINQFVFPSTAESIKQAELDAAGTDILIGGHSGIPGGQRVRDRVWLNAGAIGMPANDGTPDGWYLLLIPEEERLVCRWQRLRYPVEKTVRKMRSVGMANGYSDTLHTGLWPSMDVLPEAERSCQGRPIELNEMIC